MKKKKKSFLIQYNHSKWRDFKGLSLYPGNLHFDVPSHRFLAKIPLFFLHLINNLWCWSEGLFFLPLTSLGWMDGFYLIEQFLCS